MTKPPAKRELKQERAERTRVEILESAIQLFSRQGFLSTTMADLAKAIKMSSGALYWHFPTKEDILLAAIEELHRRFVSYYQDLITQDRKRSAREQLIAILARTQDVLRENAQYATFFAVVTAESINRIERAETALREAFSVYVYLIASIIRYGQKKTGEMRTDVDADTMAHALVSTFAGLIVHQQLFRQEVSYEPLVGTLNMLMVDGACQTDRAPTEGRARAANQ